MKENRIEKTKIEVTYEYEALDGSIFKTKEECEKYERSAALIVYSKYQPLVISRKTEYEIYGAGSEEYKIDLVKINKVEDIDILLHMYSLYNPRRDENDILEEHNKLIKWFKDGEIVFIGRGCSYDNYDYFWFIGTMNGVIEHIKKACNETN